LLAAEASVSEQTIMDLLADPSGLLLEAGSTTMTDEHQRDFAHINTETMARTALLEIDAGARLERYLVATNAERDLNDPGSLAGVTAERAMQIVGKEFTTEDPQGVSVLTSVSRRGFSGLVRRGTVAPTQQCVFAVPMAPEPGRSSCSLSPTSCTM
jgi:hypothetical protein